MFNRLRGLARRLRRYLQLSRTRGRGAVYSLLQLPLDAVARVYRRAGQWCNDRLLAPLFGRLHRRWIGESSQHGSDGHFYLIVMPGSLHFLIACLRQLPDSLSVTLVCNGAAPWERKLLRREYGSRPSVRLLTLPGTSYSHGAVITLLLRSNNKAFGLLDHDLYVFRPDVFQRLALSDQHSMKAVFSDTSESTGLEYPHTWFLFLNTPRLKKIMVDHRVTARSYRRAPARTRAALAAVGLGDGVYLKEYHRFYDTLHLLLALAWHEGLQVDYDRDAAADIAHLGGTSTGSLATKDLSHLYMSMRLLEYVDHPELNRRYGPEYAPFDAALQIRVRLQPTPETQEMLERLELIMEHLQPSPAG